MDGWPGREADRARRRPLGGRFDGTIELAYSVKHWLMSDGPATLACSPDTGGLSGHLDASGYRRVYRSVILPRPYSVA